MTDMKAVFVHIKENGEYDIHSVTPGVVVVWIDEGAPNDRVFVDDSVVPESVMRGLVGDSKMGSRLDDRHKAIKHRVLAAESGKPHLELVEEQ